VSVTLYLKQQSVGTTQILHQENFDSFQAENKEQRFGGKEARISNYQN